MNRFISCVVALAALIASLEAISPEAEPAEPDCPAVAPCADRQQIALSPDGPDSETAAAPPPNALIVEIADATAGALPPYVEDNSTPLRRLPTRPMPQADESWLTAIAPSLPPYVEDYSPPLRRRLPRRPMPQPDEGWLGATTPSLRPLGWM